MNEGIIMAEKRDGSFSSTEYIMIQWHCMTHSLTNTPAPPIHEVYALAIKKYIQTLTRCIHSAAANELEVPKSKQLSNKAKAKEMPWSFQHLMCPSDLQFHQKMKKKTCNNTTANLPELSSENCRQTSQSHILTRCRVHVQGILPEALCREHRGRYPCE